MSFNAKIITTYSKSLFQTVNGFQKIKKTTDLSLEELKKFDISKIISSTEQQYEKAVTVDAIGEELSLLSSIITSSKRLQTFFKNPTIPEQKKLDLLVQFFPGLTPITRSFLQVLSEKSHLSLIPEIFVEYNKTLLKFQNSTRVKLITASILQENYGLLLLKTLKTITKSKEVLLEISYNPQLLGGLILEYNSMSIDVSILKEFSLFFNEV
jgi:F-type H+-transporting ATPase subunit delta